MRHRPLIGTALAGALVLAGAVFAVGGTALAETEALASSADAAEPSTVTLPTGDRVTLLPNGIAAVDPGPGREDAAFVTPTSWSGDVMVVPTDRVDEIQSGEEDARRYNVSELLAAGQTDAAAAPESALDDRAYAGLLPDATPAELAAEVELQQLHVTVSTREGKAPDGAWIQWSTLDGEDGGEIAIDETGAGAVELPPGDYTVTASFWNEPTALKRGQYILGISTVTVGQVPTELVIDGAAADPVTVDVDRDDAQLLATNLSINARNQTGNSVGADTFLGNAHDAYLLPEPDLPGHELRFIYQPVLTSPEGVVDPYVYNLAFADDTGFPDSTAFVAADEELATVHTGYRDLGVPADGVTCRYGDSTLGQIGNGYCIEIDTPAPSQRTEYYTATSEINWFTRFQAGQTDESGYLVDGFGVSFDAVFKPGEYERVMPHGGLSAGPVTMHRFNDGESDLMVASLDLIGGGNGESLVVAGAMGDVTLSRDGKVIASVEDLDYSAEVFFAELPDGDSGRYTVTTEVNRPAGSTVFGTDASASWSFDSEPGPEGEGVPIAAPVVQFTADDIDGGWAHHGPQSVTLDFRTFGNPETSPDAVDMSFDVSYDDGATWQDVDIDRIGNSATTVLDHPADAEFVSVRMEAVADDGSEVAHTLIRAYGLR